MTEKIYKTISKEEYDHLKTMSWETAQGELFYRTTGIRRYWRPAMAWLYFVIVSLDFVIFPIIWYQLGGQGEYKSYTLQNGGMFHLAMGAIVATASIGRSWEKMDQYKMDTWGQRVGYGNYNDPYQNPGMPYPGSPPVMMPHDNIGDALSENEDEIIPPNPETK